MPTDMTPAEAAKILEHPESHAFGYTALLLEACKTAASVLRKLAAGEMREVVKEKWVHLGGDDWCCSGCGYVEAKEVYNGDTLSRYCQSRGALMYGKDEKDAD